MFETEKHASLPLLPSRPDRFNTRRTRVPYLDHLTFGILLFLATLVAFFLYTLLALFFPSTSHTASSLHSCAWSTLEHHVPLLDVLPISKDEFLTRQSTLAQALETADAQAFIAEPSASSAYFANISSSYELSERPFLIVLDQHGDTTLLVPKFERARILDLEMVFAGPLNVVEWAEEEDPYAVLKQAMHYSKVILDEHARYMIAAGLSRNGVEVVPATEGIQSIRAVKSAAEIAILRGINEFTVELVRSLQQCIKIGMTQSTIVDAASQLFDSAGIGKGVWSIVLIGSQASNPHGGGTGRTLQKGEFLLIDIGSSLHSYGSDVTRTILPSGSTVSKELWDYWQLVHDAQTAAIARMNVGEICKDVDGAAREVIRAKGLGEFFTHRLGHGLGLEMHEHPYLNGVNGEKLREGMVVTNEPGVYVMDSQADEVGRKEGFGVRIEDAILVTKEGGLVMTGTRAKSPYEP